MVGVPGSTGFRSTLRMLLWALGASRMMWGALGASITDQLWHTLLPTNIFHAILSTLVLGNGDLRQLKHITVMIPNIFLFNIYESQLHFGEIPDASLCCCECNLTLARTVRNPKISPEMRNVCLLQLNLEDKSSTPLTVVCDRWNSGACLLNAHCVECF